MIKKKVVQPIIQMITGLGFHVQSIDVDVFSQIRTLLYNYDVNKEDTVVLIDISKDEIVFIIIREREYFFSHHLSLQLKDDQAEQMDREQLGNVIVKELKRLIFGHRLGREIGDLSSLYCTGCDNRVGDIVEDLTKTVDVKIEMINPFKKLSILPSVAQSKALKEYPEQMISSLGVFFK